MKEQAQKIDVQFLNKLVQNTRPRKIKREYEDGRSSAIGTFKLNKYLGCNFNRI